MGVFDFFSRARRRRGANGDPLIARRAAEIANALHGIGLYVDSKCYGNDFWEIRASSSPRLITTPHSEASGVALLLAAKFDPPALVFEQINSRRRGLGRQMVAAVMTALRARPGGFARVKVNDLSPVTADGRRWWEHVADAYPDFDWRITHDPDATHWPAPQEAVDEREAADENAPDFVRKRETLKALAAELGYDRAMVTLSAERKTFDYLGQSFTSEGEATPDGRITIYYDPHVSDARMGCCLAHEIQHARYFAVRDAYRAEPEGGPLHRRFETFTPQALAAQRGVSNYANEHWDAWKGAAPPRLFSDELEEGLSEPINETIAEVAKALYNWGPDVRLNPLWRELHDAINDEYEKLRAP